MKTIRIICDNVRIFGTLAKHLLAPNSKSKWERVRDACEELGVLFVKVGQALSLRYEFISQEGRDALERLLDNTPQLSLATVEGTVAHEIGPIDETFAWLDATPAGSASIAQVHRARLKTGEEVAVKIRRPGIAEEFERTVRAITPVARALDWVPFLRRHRPSWILRELVEQMSSEIDFVTEVENIRKLRQRYCRPNNRSNYHVVVPRPYGNLCGKNVIVMDWIDGTPLNRCSKEQTKSARPLLRHLFHTIVEPIIASEDHVFHMDPHPANILYIDQHTIGLIDCGLMGQINSRVSSKIAQTIIGIYAGNVEVMANAMFSLGESVTPSQRKKAVRDFEAYVRGVRERPFGSWCLDMLSILTKHGIQFPPIFPLLGRSIFIMDGVIDKYSVGKSAEEVIGGLLQKYIAMHVFAKAPAILGAAGSKARDEVLRSAVGLLGLAWQARA